MSLKDVMRNRREKKTWLPEKQIDKSEIGKHA